jgi:hypothetical protein
MTGSGPYTQGLQVHSEVVSGLDVRRWSPEELFESAIQFIFGIGRKRCHAGNPLQFKKAVITIREKASLPATLRPAVFFGLTFSTGAGENREGYRVFIQLNTVDEDLLSGVFVNAKSRAIVRRAAILDFLPSSLNDEWPSTGYIFDQSGKTDWDVGVPPTVLRGHNVWIIEDTICAQ